MADIRYAVEGDRAPNGSPLIFEKCIEVGHVFKLGTKYSDSMKVHFLDESGAVKPFIMGCYGIGLNRIMAAAIEASHDADGICWPVSIAPYSVHITALDVRDENVFTAAKAIHDELEAVGIDTLFDDRDARPGHKFKDADLIGIPIRLTIGKRSLDENVVELKLRSSDEVRKLKPAEVLTAVKQVIEEITPQATG